VIAPRVARTLIVVAMLVAISAAAALFVQVDGGSDSASDTLYSWVPLASLIAVAGAVLVFAIGRAARR
jgi:hypothetical protein